MNLVWCDFEQIRMSKQVKKHFDCVTKSTWLCRCFCYTLNTLQKQVGNMISKVSELKNWETFSKDGVTLWQEPNGCLYRYEKDRERVGQRWDDGSFDWWHLENNSINAANHKIIELINTWKCYKNKRFIDDWN